MKRGPFLFLLSLFVILLLLGVWMMIPQIEYTGEPRPIAVQSPVDTVATKELPKEDRDSSDSPAHLESFAYLGRVKPPESRSLRKTSIGAGTIKSMLPAGLNRMSEGDIPELTIELREWDIRTVANRLGFVLVATTDQRVLGKVIDDSFMPMTHSELSRYSTRARSAEAIKNYAELCDRIARQFGVSPYEVRLMFLVPLSVERRFVGEQRRILNEMSLAPTQVVLMRGFYDSQFNVQITELVTKDGKSIDIR